MTEETSVDALGLLPGFVARRPGAKAVATAIEAARVAAGLPSLSLIDYRFVLGRPTGIPFSFPVRVIYKPESDEEVDLGTFRVKA